MKKAARVSSSSSSVGQEKLCRIRTRVRDRTRLGLTKHDWFEYDYASSSPPSSPPPAPPSWSTDGCSVWLPIPGLEKLPRIRTRVQHSNPLDYPPTKYYFFEDYYCTLSSSTDRCLSHLTTNMNADGCGASRV